jgi:pilus assembly protein TadC
MFLLVWGYTVATGIVAEFYASLTERRTAVVMVIIASLVQVVSLILLVLELWRRRRTKSQ